MSGEGVSSFEFHLNDTLSFHSQSLCVWRVCVCVCVVCVCLGANDNIYVYIDIIMCVHMHV